MPLVPLLLLDWLAAFYCCVKTAAASQCLNYTTPLLSHTEPHLLLSSLMYVW
jgi:hypothetical protein